MTDLKRYLQAFEEYFLRKNKDELVDEILKLIEKIPAVIDYYLESKN